MINNNWRDMSPQRPAEHCVRGFIQSPQSSLRVAVLPQFTDWETEPLKEVGQLPKATQRGTDRYGAKARAVQNKYKPFSWPSSPAGLSKAFLAPHIPSGCPSALGSVITHGSPVLSAPRLEISNWHQAQLVLKPQAPDRWSHWFSSHWSKYSKHGSQLLPRGLTLRRSAVSFPSIANPGQLCG